MTRYAIFSFAVPVIDDDHADRLGFAIESAVEKNTDGFTISIPIDIGVDEDERGDAEDERDAAEQYEYERRYLSGSGEHMDDDSYIDYLNSN